MKLVELLARELVEWPEGAACIVQDSDGETKADEGFNPSLGSSREVWIREDLHRFTIYAERATDHSTAIVTREMWKAERARIAKQEQEEMTPCEKLGYKIGDKFEMLVNYSGVSSGQLAELYRDDGSSSPLFKTSPCKYDNCDGADGAFFHLDGVRKIDQSDESAENETNHMEVNIVKVFNPQIGQIDGPIKWRDRIREIDTTVEELEEERAALVQQLEGEGFQLITAKVKPGEDMDDWRNWKAGDIVTAISPSTGYTPGFSYQLKDFDRDRENVYTETDDVGSKTNG